MLTKAFVLIETEMGRAKEINGLLRRFEEIMSTDLVTNPYDIIAIVGEERRKSSKTSSVGSSGRLTALSGRCCAKRFQ
jgi:hypothetical protein